MQKSKSFILLSIFITLIACVETGNRQGDLKYDYPQELLQKGQLKELCVWADSAKQTASVYSDVWMKADSFQQIADRLQLEFCVSQEEFCEQLKHRRGSVVEEELSEWERNGMLEWRWINGEKRYFRRAATNLILLLQEEEGLIDGSLEQLCLSHMTDVISEVEERAVNVVLPMEFNITYTMKLRVDEVPDGAVVRCWMPFPKSVGARQTDVRLVSASESNYVLASDTCLHRSIYMEKKAVVGLETVFSVSYTYRSYAEYYDLREERVLPYDTEAEVFKRYTVEQTPHIVFTDRIKSLTDSICGDESDPYEVVRRIYYWIDNNIPWAGAQEYCLMNNIPGYVLDNKRGDCGMQTMLFMTMARYKNIPVKWQSGWMLHPDEVNLHDWCEVYYQGVGWVPLDVSFNLQRSDEKKVREFYITGIDAYRLIVNDGIGASFSPSKKFLRSEPWDFQRGEMEWEGGNIYFDKWECDMYLTP